ncbi:aldo/keto reductase [Tropicimonas isoalkanivorans]|uniref:Predicted oxidoreductase n=1 Tax=Tropicimonas isoalkanivorans TaxID=441112 RepID=A0A1I1LLM4_9RHOB|nr:aldo/keto reductase [Tropicimonas isoalkanivorans]SFC70370.1 Predicted oxidoreductase [Tropicimonas isoalkanivorans]
MKTKRLGASDLEVTDLCLGTMTFGTNTDAADAHRQLDMALDAGIDFIDTAEMYPVNPVRAETVGRTEEIVGAWIAASGRRDDIVLATKISGANGGFVRDGRGIHPDTLVEAADASLSRLKTDVIDIYQLHWPNRGSYHFRQNWTYDPSTQNREETEAHMVEALEAMADLQKAGKIRHFGLSNESAWGTAEWLRLAGQTGGPRMVSIQNEYSLLCRLFDTDLAELSVNEDVPLLAYSPLAAGLLTGKYRHGEVPAGSRMSINETLAGRVTPRAHEAVEAYLSVAETHGLDLVHMALAFCRARPFMGSVILGATTSAQLEHILQGRDLVLSEEVLKELDEIHRTHPMPF